MLSLPAPTKPQGPTHKSHTGWAHMSYKQASHRPYTHFEHIGQTHMVHIPVTNFRWLGTNFTGFDQMIDLTGGSIWLDSLCTNKQDLTWILVWQWFYFRLLCLHRFIGFSQMIAMAGDCVQLVMPAPIHTMYSDNWHDGEFVSVDSPPIHIIWLEGWHNVTSICSRMGSTDVGVVVISCPLTLSVENGERFGRLLTSQWCWWKAFIGIWNSIQQTFMTTWWCDVVLRAASQLVATLNSRFSSSIIYSKNNNFGQCNAIVPQQTPNLRCVTLFIWKGNVVLILKNIFLFWS